MCQRLEHTIVYQATNGDDMRALVFVQVSQAVARPRLTAAPPNPVVIDGRQHAGDFGPDTKNAENFNIHFGAQSGYAARALLCAASVFPQTPARFD